MATLGDLKARIIQETNRDDLVDDMASALANVIAKSIEQYAAIRWWFNERRITISTVAGIGSVLWPADATNSLRVIDVLTLDLTGGNRWPLAARSVDEWEAITQPAATGGQPTDYLVENTLIRLWPVPNQVWNLGLRGLFDVTPIVSADTDSNFWTNQGADLITAQAKMRLYRDYLSATTQDPRFANAALQEADAYTRLRSESTRRTATGRIRPSW